MFVMPSEETLLYLSFTLRLCVKKSNTTHKIQLPAGFVNSNRDRVGQV
jgi:hypothetical protein